MNTKYAFFSRPAFISHSSELKCLCLMNWPSKMHQNLSYFWNTKTHAFGFFIPCYIIFPLYGLCWHRLEHSFGWGENKVARSEKTYLWVFIFPKYGKFWSILRGYIGINEIQAKANHFFFYINGRIFINYYVLFSFLGWYIKIGQNSRETHFCQCCSWWVC